MARYVIIGGGCATINCIEGIRSEDPDGSITLVCSESRSNYGRPLISYYLEGKTDLERMSYRGADFYEKNAVTALHDVSAEKIVPLEKGGKVLLSSGEELPYDKLCVCTGSSPFVPPIPGLDSVEKRFAFYTLDNALALEKAIGPDSRVLIIGAGFIGLKCAEGLYGRVAAITVCDLAPCVMARILDQQSAAILEKRMRDVGIDLLVGDTAASLEPGVAHMKSGKDVPFDVLVTAVGLRPNKALVEEAGGECDKGIIVGTDMSTSIHDVYAAGDCVQTTDVSSGQSGLIATMPSAGMKGRCAGINMAGGSCVYEKDLRLNSIGLFGMHVASAGNFGDEALSEFTEDSCKRLFTDGGRLCGFIIIGDVGSCGVYTSLIRDRVPLDTIDFEAVKQHPSLMAFSRQYRAEKLGGEV